MRNYIKLLSVALLIGGAAQVSAMDAAFYADLKAKGRVASSVTGADYAAFTGVGLPDGTTLSAVRSRLQALAEADPTAIKPARSTPAVAAPVSIDLTAIDAIFDAAHSNVTPAAGGVYPALAFDGGVKKLDAAVLAAHATSYAQIILLDAFKDLKPANIAALSYVTAELLNDADLKTSFGNVASGKAPIGAFATDTDVLTKASLAKPFSALAALIAKRYNATISGKTFHDGTSAVGKLYDDAQLPAPVVAKLSDETALTAYITALTA